jgi:transcriptional regulator with XRE-family HTH domain
MSEADRLLDEFKAAFEAGREIDLEALLAGAPEAERQELGERIDSYLMNAPRRAWDADAYAASAARQSVERVWESLEGVSGTWPELLPRLRKAARIKRQELVRGLAERLGVAGREEKVAAYYNEMEHGRLPAAGVSAKVIEALAAIVDADVELIRRAGRATAAPGAEAAALFARTAQPSEEQAEEAEAPGPADAERAEAGRDEIDELFRGG